MRRSQNEITDPAEVEALLRNGDVLHLATSDAEGPYVVPLSFAYSDGVVWAHSAEEGRKIDALTADPRVSFTVVGFAELADGDGPPCTWSTRYRSVIGSGRARIVTQGPELLQGLSALVERFGGDPADLPAAPRGVAVIRIDVERLTGKASDG
jgi:uncharacterized protein